MVDRRFLPLLILLLALTGDIVSRRGNALAAGPMADAAAVTVLRDGRVFTGTLSPVPGGYRLDQSGGYVIIPQNEIQVTAASLQAAYQALRDALKSPSPEDHVRLAQWCLANGLADAALTEVQDALRLDPRREDARALLKHLDSLLNRPPVVPEESAPALPATAFMTPKDRTSLGLSREAHKDFVARVQPLLMNKCASAGCHGASAENRLKLTNARLETTLHRLATESNLNTLFTFIDFQHPERSLLLTKPGEPTPVHQRLFLGPRNAPQFQILESWVQQVVREKEALATEPPPAVVTAASPAVTPQQLQPVAADAAPARATESRREPGVLDEIRREQLPDAFDPDAFNRMVHGFTAAESRAAAKVPAK